MNEFKTKSAFYSAIEHRDAKLSLEEMMSTIGALLDICLRLELIQEDDMKRMAHTIISNITILNTSTSVHGLFYSIITATNVSRAKYNNKYFRV